MALVTSQNHIDLLSSHRAKRNIELHSFYFPITHPSPLCPMGTLEGAFKSELSNREIDRIWATGDAVIVTVVGSGMRHTPGVAGKVFSALGEKNVNVIAIAQGSSEVAISLVVDSPDMELAVRTLHNLVK